MILDKSFDKQVPQQLKKTQVWFGSIIERPIDVDNNMNPVSPSGRPMTEESAEFINPSPTLRPEQRIQIYNQQYWWRLINNLHETFPLVTRLFGYHGFNFTIAMPYLVKYPPRHWNLNTLGDRLPQWIEEEYTAADKKLIYDAARLDLAFVDSFIAPQSKPLSTENMPAQSDALLDVKCTLQPHLHLFQLPYELFAFRIEFLKETPEHWIEHDFPSLAKERQYHFVMFRNTHNDISWREVSPVEYALLQCFQKGSSISEACDWIEQQSSEIVEEASKNLHLWFQEWVIRQWLTRDA